MAAVTFSITDLFSAATKAAFYAKLLSFAESVGLPVESWRAGDPTRSVYHVASEEFETRDITAASYAKSGFLDSATGDWLTLLADQVYNVQREEATAAADTCRLKNVEAGVFAWDVGDLVFRSSVNGKTYHNTTAGSLSTLNEETDVGFVADEAGADSSLATDELDEIVTAMAGVEIISSGAAVANDEEDDAALRVRCRASTGALSPNGPADAYRFVATSSELTGNSETTRVYVADDSVTGDVSVYCAGSDGGVSGTAVTAVETALIRYCTPLCITVSVFTASAVTQNVTAAVTLKSSVGVTQANAETALETAITDMMGAYPVGGISGNFYRDAIRGAIFSVYGSDAVALISITTPAADVALSASQVIKAGTIAVTVSFV